MEEQDDYIKTLLEGCLRGHRVSQKMLYQHYYNYGMSISLRYASNREEAAEILNDAFMKIFSNLKKFDLSKLSSDISLFSSFTADAVNVTGAAIVVSILQRYAISLFCTRIARQVSLHLSINNNPLWTRSK